MPKQAPYLVVSTGVKDPDGFPLSELYVALKCRTPRGQEHVIRSKALLRPRGIVPRELSPEDLREPVAMLEQRALAGAKKMNYIPLEFIAVENSIPAHLLPERKGRS